jgi:hypothetical protein
MKKLIVEARVPFALSLFGELFRARMRPLPVKRDSRCEPLLFG